MENVIEQFYDAFHHLDAEKMVACYHKDIIFEDPAFGVLKGDRAKNMWLMLCKTQQGKKFDVNSSAITLNGTSGSAHWEAHYNFSSTGRKVHNIVEAKLELKDGLIIKHTDHFNLHEWSKQAFGLKGFLLGWTSFFKTKLNKQTNLMLTQFEQQQ